MSAALSQEEEEMVVVVVVVVGSWGVRRVTLWHMLSPAAGMC